VAAWTTTSDHDTYVFVPQDVTGPFVESPYIDFDCNDSDDACEEEYPFVCVDEDEQDAGDEIATFYALLQGTYEYWIELDDPTPAGEVTVNLVNSAGNVIRSWSSPEVPNNPNQVGWHVFDIDGSTGIVTSVDVVDLSGDMPNVAHSPNTDVCPG
jgi:hypothetical protein